MTRNVSVSKTGQNLPPPPKAERDKAASKDAGRKAVEEPIEEAIEEGRARQNCGCAHDGEKQTSPFKKHSEAPIGLALETVAEEYLEEK